MKKALLSALCVLGLGMFANAHEASVTFSALGYSNGEKIESLKVNDDITFNFDKGDNSNAPSYWNTGTALRLYGGNTMEVVGVEGVTITEIAFNTAKGTNGWNSASTASEGEFAPKSQNADNSWTGSANSVTFTQGGTSGHVRINSVVVTYTGGTGGGSIIVPEDPSFGYVSSINVDKKYALYADGYVALVNGSSYGYLNASAVALDGNKIKTAEANAITFEAAEGGYYIKNSNDKYFYASAKNDGSYYNSFNYAAMNETVAAQGVWAVSFENGCAKIVNTWNNYYIQLPVGQNFGMYDEEKGVLPMLFEMGAAGETMPEPPVVIYPVVNPRFSAVSGELLYGQAVEITCETEGASIYYTLDGTTPSAASTLYTEPIIVKGEVTIKAIAVAEGYYDSAVVEATYTIKAPTAVEANQAIFEWAIPGSLNPVQDVPDATNNAQKGVEVDGITFSNNGVTLVCDSLSASTPARLWNNKGAIELRAYKNSTITIASDSKIVKVEFFGSKAGKSLIAYNGEEGTIEDVEKQAVWTANDGVNSVVFDIVGTINASHFIVTFEGSSVVMGDANGDGEISIADVVALCNAVLGIEVESFNASAADLDESGDLSVADVVNLVNIILRAE